MGLNWFITGGCGFIGRNLVKSLLDEDPSTNIRIFDNLSVGSVAELSEITTNNILDHESNLEWTERVGLVVGDVQDRHELMKYTVGANVIVHLAANTGVGPSVENPLQDCMVNVNGTVNILEAARTNGVNRFVFASSSAPVGEVIPPIHEEIAPHPVSPYGASKLAGEGYCSAYFHCFGIETIALRFGNVYGPLSGKKESVVAKFINQATQKLPLHIHGDGTQTRDFIYVEDLINAIKNAASINNIGGNIFQIATNSETTLIELCETLKASMDKHGMHFPEVIHGPSRLGDVQRNFSDTSKAKNMLNWQSTTSLADGLDATVQFFKSQQDKQ